ncbi:hypothetical protein E2C01_035589 [Portunus trituberculatus]|uniref:Uncharacterized protein n=1 Tax=Portunus trituberculatus TaxID=210409 RepID=A0A5B7FA58_PORTR|nr:hypothetical protein [Portunus trituberculatus]
MRPSTEGFAIISSCITQLVAEKNSGWKHENKKISSCIKQGAMLMTVKEVEEEEAEEALL